MSKLSFQDQADRIARGSTQKVIYGTTIQTEDQPFHVVGDIRLDFEKAAVREVSPTLSDKIAYPQRLLAPVFVVLPAFRIHNDPTP